MRFILVYFVFLMIIAAPAHSLTLVCKVHAQNETSANSIGVGYSQKTMDNLMPRNQLHIVDTKNKTVRYGGDSFKPSDGDYFQTELDVIDDRVIRWIYHIQLFDEKTDSNEFYTRLEYQFFRKTKKLVAQVDLGTGYRKIGTRNSSCLEK